MFIRCRAALTAVLASAKGRRWVHTSSWVVCGCDVKEWKISNHNQFQIVQPITFPHLVVYQFFFIFFKIHASIFSGVAC